MNFRCGIACAALSLITEQGVCRLLLETGENAIAFFGGIREQTEVLCTVLKLPHNGKDLLVSIDCDDGLAA